MSKTDWSELLNVIEQRKHYLLLHAPIPELIKHLDELEHLCSVLNKAKTNPTTLKKTEIEELTSKFARLVKT